MAREIDHLETALELLDIADARGDWMGDEGPLTDAERFGINQLNLSAIAHALVAIAQNGELA